MLYFYLYNLKLVCTPPCNFSVKQVFVCIYILNYNNAGNHIFIKKHNRFVGHICNLINKNRVDNQFYIFQQKKTNIHPSNRDKCANYHFY